MKKLVLFAMVVAMTVLGSSCTENTRARSFGGTQEIELKENERFVNITWKDSDLWVVTEDTLTGIGYARERSRYGVLEGTVIIKRKGTTGL